MNISLEFPWTKERYIQAGKAVYKYEMAYSYKKYIGYAFLALMMYGLLSNTYDLLYLGLIFSIYWHYIRPYLQTTKLKKVFTKEGLHRTNVKFLINNKGVTINDNLIPWNHIAQVIIHKDGFLLDRNEGYPFLPLDAFKSDKDAQNFITLVDSLAIPIKNIN